MVVRETVTKGQEPRSQTVMTFFADTGLDELETHRVQAATSVLEMRLRDILREQLGGTYSVGVGYSNTSPQPGYGTTSVQFGSSPENVEKLHRRGDGGARASAEGRAVGRGRAGRQGSGEEQHRRKRCARTATG